jgi:oligopeptide transport system substrate-binding protein
MKKKMLSVLLAAACVTGLLSGCGSSAETTTGSNDSVSAVSDSSEETTAESEDGVYRVLYSSEVSTLNYLTTATTNEYQVGANVVDTLVEYDSYGEIQPSLATEWSYDADTLTWTFTLRDGQKWIDTNGNEVADVTAQDFVDAMAYVLNPENGSSTASNLFGTILNAEEYYNGLAGEEGYSEIDFSEVGVKAVDATTLQYTLASECPYFLSMLTYVCFMPAYGPQLEELGTGFATSADTMYYCGAYYISSFEPQVQMVLTKNPSNWDAEHVYINEIQKTYNAEADTIGAEMAKRGEIDYTTLGSDIVDSWMEDPETSNMVSMQRPSIDFAYFYCFNFNVRALNEDFYRDGMEGYSIDEEYEPWNWEIAVNNENFRQSIMHAINRVSTVYISTGDYTDPETYIQNTITPAGFAVDEATGKDYTELDAFSDITASDFYDEDAALAYKEAAIEELTAEGVTFPVKTLVRYNPSTTNWEEECVVLEQQLESVLGSDYIDIIVEAGPSDGFLTEVRRSSDYMLLLCNWGADYADPETWTDPFYQSENDDGTYHRGMRYAYLAYAIEDNTASADTVKEYFELVEAAKAITDDTTARYEAFAKAESYLIEHALAIPYGVSVSDFVVSRLNPWEGQYAAFGVSNLRYKGQKLYDHAISMEEFEASAAEH